MKKTISILLIFVLVFSLAVTALAGEYVVVSGDSLWSIANRFGITVDELMSANKLSTEGLQIGQKLIIPDANTPSTPQPEQPSTGEVEVPSAPGMDIPTTAVDFIDAISFDVRDTDIRDVLNVIAKYSGKKIIYFGQPQKVTLSCSLVSCMKAVGMLVEAGENLGYLTDGDVILVGPESRMTAVFLYTDISKTLKLENMTAADFTDVLTKLGVNTTSLAADEDDKNKLIVTAKPSDMANVVTTQMLVDRQINFPTDELTGKPLLNMKEITLSHISVDAMTKFIDLFSLRCSVITNYNNNGKIYVAGTTGAVNDLEKLLARLDIEINANEGTRVLVYPYTVANKDREVFLNQLINDNAGGALVFVTQEGNKKVVYLVGYQSAIDVSLAQAAAYDVQ